MNKRIKKLLFQAGVFDGREDLYWSSEEQLEEFAKLIVRECAEIAKTAEPYRSDDLILRHFGVEPNE